MGENKFPQARKPSKNVEVTPAVACSAAMIDQLQGLKSPITEKRFFASEGRPPIVARLETNALFDGVATCCVAVTFL